MSEQAFNPKALKQLADVCRKAGIKTFKGFGFEFTLADELPQKRAKSPGGAHTQGAVESDEPSAEELMFWSSGQGSSLLPAGDDQGEQGSKA